MGRGVHRFISTPSLWTLIIISVAACSGRLTAGTPYSGADPVTRDGGGSSAASCAGASQGSDPLRRLSHSEYRNTLRHLFPGVTVPEADLPADERPKGFDNDASALLANSILIETYATIAQQIGSAAAEAAISRVGCTSASASECGDPFIRFYARRIFRRPATDGDVASFLPFFTGAPDYQTAAARVLAAMLASPEFLYRFENPAESNAVGLTTADAFTLASRLSFTIWAAAPDDALLDAAESGALATDDGLRAEAHRMLDDARARDGVLHYFSQWLQLDKLDKAHKLAADDFTPEKRDAMKTEVVKLVERLVFDQPGSLTELFTTRKAYINELLAPIYGVPAPPAGQWLEVDLDPTQRSGILTRAAFLASQAHATHASPVYRGVYVLTNVLCVPMGAPPPEAEAQKSATEGAASGPLSNRERYDAVTRAAAGCASCHDTINPIGYAFENYDSMGRFITTDAGKAIDAAGQYNELAYSNAIGLSDGISTSAALDDCAVQKYLTYVYGNGPGAADSCARDRITQALSAASGALEELVMSTVLDVRFRQVRLPEAR